MSITSFWHRAWEKLVSSSAVAPHNHTIQKHASGVRAASRPSCVCFSTCTLDDYALFEAQRPRMITSNSSPWLAYLRTVYHEKVAVPFDLSRLIFFYMPNERWRSLHGRRRIEWPAAICQRQYNFRLMSPPPNETTRCPKRTCERWLPNLPAWDESAKVNVSSVAHNRSGTSSVRRVQSRRKFSGVGYPLKGRPEPVAADGTNAGYVIKPPSGYAEKIATSHSQPGPANRNVTGKLPPRKWVEVMRVNHGGEGEQD